VQPWVTCFHQAV